MKIKYFLFIFLFSLNGFAQLKDLKKHHADLKKATTDSLRFNALINLSWDYSLADLDSSAYYLLRAESVLKKLKSNKYVLRYTVNYIEAQANYNNRKGNYAKALELYVECLKLSEQQGFKIYHAYALLIVGMFAEELEDHQSAIVYLRRAEKKFLELKPKQVLFDEVHVFNRLGEIYANLGKTDSALYYYQKSYGIGQTNQLGPGELAFAYYGIGTVHQRNNNLEIAKSYHQKAVELAQTQMNEPSEVPNQIMARAYKGLAEICKQTGDIRGARSYYEKIVENNREKDKILLSAYQNLAEITKYKENDLAVGYFDKASALRDSLYDNRTQKDYQRILYKERQREKQRAEAEQKKAEQTKMLIQYAGISLVIVCFLVGLILLTRSVIVNQKWLKVLGIVGLLLVFEFINLLLHPYIAHLTHHSPIGMLLIMVAIAALLVPLHHKIEHWATNKLIEKNKLARLRIAQKIIDKEREEAEPMT